LTKAKQRTQGLLSLLGNSPEGGPGAVDLEGQAGDSSSINYSRDAKSLVQDIL